MSEPVTKQADEDVLAQEDVPVISLAQPVKLKLKRRIVIKKRATPTPVIKANDQQNLSDVSLPPLIEGPDPESLTLDDLNGLEDPQYSWIAPVVIKYIETEHLQDENHRIRILLDSKLQALFQTDLETTTYQQLYHLMKDWIATKNKSAL